MVTEKTPLNGDVIGISSFGLCNSFSHVILKQNKKCKTNVYKQDEMFKDGLPRLIFVSGRNEQGVVKLIEKIKNSQMDEEFAALLQNVFYKSLNAHYFRSFYIAPDKSEGSQEISVSDKTIIILLYTGNSFYKYLFTVSSSNSEKAHLVHIFWNGISVEWNGKTTAKYSYIC